MIRIRRQCVGLLAVALMATPGCMVLAGTAKPKEIVTEDGERVLACDVRGLVLIAGNASICGTATGGEVSEAMGNLIGEIIDPVMRIIGGIGAGLSSATPETTETLETEAEPVTDTVTSRPRPLGPEVIF